MAKNSFLRKLGSTMYGAAEGILDAGTFGLSDNLTDTLWTDVVNKGGANNLNQFRGAGNMAGAVGAGFLTGNISGSIEEGLEGFGYLAANSQNEQFQKAEKFANMAAQLSGFAGGANNLTGIGTKMYGLAGNPVVSQPVNQVSSLLSSIPKMPSTNVPKDVVYGNRQSTNYADGGPIKPRPIFVSDKSDPRLRRYNDSLTLYNSFGPRGFTINDVLRAGRMSSEGASLLQEFRRGDFLDAPPLRRNFSSQELYNQALADYQTHLLSRRTGILPTSTSWNLNHEHVFGNYIYSKPKQPIKYADPKIVEKQKLLKEAGLYEGELDGLWGPKSEAAWAEYNKPKPNNSSSSTEIVEYQEPPKIKGVWGEQIYKPNTNNKEYDHRYVVEQEDGSLIELPNAEQYKRYKEKYGLGNDLPVRYGRMPQFRNTPVIQLFAKGGPIKSPVIKDYDRDEAPRQGNYLLPDMNRPGYVDTLNQLRTEYRMGINDPRLNKEVLIPTVINGRQFSPDAAVDRYYNTGYHMGMFDTPKQAELASMLRTQKYNTLIDPVRTSPILQFKKGGAVEDPVKPWTVGQPIPGTTKQKISPELQKFLAAEKTKLANQQKLKTAEEQLSRESEMRESLYRNPTGLSATIIMPMSPQQVQQRIRQNQQPQLTAQQLMMQKLAADNARLANTVENTKTTQQQFTPEERANALPMKSTAVQAADVATDIMQLGNFIPHPIGQSIGKMGNYLGATIDGYQATQNLYEGDYKNAAINFAGIALPTALELNTFKRNSKYLKPGQTLYPLSPQGLTKVNPGTIHFTPRTMYLEPFNKVRGMTNSNLLTNRAVLGTLGAETAYDMYKKGGMIKRADGSYSRRGLWDNIRANRGSGKKPTKQMLEQERKIKAKK